LSEIESQLEKGNYQQALDIARREAETTRCGACKIEFEDLGTQLAVASGFCPLSANCNLTLRKVQEKLEQLKDLFDPEKL